MEENYILFKISQKQAEKIAKYCYKNIKELDEKDICTLLDSIINKLETGD